MLGCTGGDCFCSCEAYDTPTSASRARCIVAILQHSNTMFEPTMCSVHAKCGGNSVSQVDGDFSRAWKAVLMSQSSHRGHNFPLLEHKSGELSQQTVLAGVLATFLWLLCFDRPRCPITRALYQPPAKLPWLLDNLTQLITTAAAAFMSHRLQSLPYQTGRRCCWGT